MTNETQKWMQRTISKVAKALLKQKKKSYDKEDKGCLYFSSDGSRCAVGHLLPAAAKQDALDNGWNSAGIYDIPSKYYKDVLGAPLETGDEDDYELVSDEDKREEFLCSFQEIHDDRKPSQWRAGFNKLARAYKLNITW